MTASVDRDTRWWERAACDGMPVGAMNPKTGDRAGLFAALKTCRPCPVTAQCLAEAMELEDYEGVRGGMPGHDRARLANGVAMKSCRCGTSFVPQFPHQKRCRLCTKDAPGDVERSPCPVCGRNVGRRKEYLTPHWPVGAKSGDPQCPGGGKPREPEPEKAPCPECGRPVRLTGNGLSLHWRPGQLRSAGDRKCPGTGSVAG